MFKLFVKYRIGLFSNPQLSAVKRNQIPDATRSDLCSYLIQQSTHMPTESAISNKHHQYSIPSYPKPQHHGNHPLTHRAPSERPRYSIANISDKGIEKDLAIRNWKLPCLNYPQGLPRCWIERHSK